MSKREDDLERELRDHLELEAEEQRGAGASAEESRLAARRAFGNVALTKEDVRSAWGWTLLEQFAADARYALRTMRRSPGVTVVAVLSLALGIGATTAIFSLADAVLLRKLPVAHPEQLDRLSLVYENSTWPIFSYPEFRALRLRFPGVDPIGKTFVGNEIVGIVRDVKGIREPARAMAYRDEDQSDSAPFQRTYYLRTDGNPAPYLAVLRQTARELDRNVAVSDLKTLDMQKAESLAGERLVATLSGFFGLLALLLAAIGIYGVVAYGVTRRTREIGIRMSLGASRGSVVWMALRGSLSLAAAESPSGCRFACGPRSWR